MPTFLWKATNSAGQKVVRRVDAEDASEARRMLVASGLSNLRLQQEELAAAARAGVEAASDPQFRAQLSAEAEAAYFEGCFPGFWAQWWKAFKEHPLWELGWIALSAWAISRGSYVWAGIAATPILLFPAVSFWFGMPLRLYNQINHAKVWSRWREVLALTDRLRRVQAWVRIGAPEWEIARCRAQALAAMGQLPEALKEFDPWTNDPGLESWMSKSHLAGIYDQAKMFDESVKLRVAASEEAPTNMSCWIDLCMHYAHRMHDLPNARAVQGRIDETLVPEMGRPYLDLIEAVMRCLEHRYAEARPKLESAVDGLAAFRHNPLVQSVELLTKSYLCLALAGSGEHAGARLLWKEVDRYLKPAREDELRNRIGSLLGEPADEIGR